MRSRTLGVAVGSSLVAHVVLLAWWDSRPQPAAAIAEVEPEPGEVIPLDLFVEEAVVEVAHAHEDEDGDEDEDEGDNDNGGARPARTVGTSGANSTEASPNGGGSEWREETRRGERPDTRVVVPMPGVIARAIIPDPGPPPSPSPLAPPKRRKPRVIRSEIQPDGRGEYRAGDLAFTAKVRRDGTVDMTDKPNFHIAIALPGRTAIGRHLETWAEDPYGTSPKDERSIKTATVPIIGGGFDLTDWAIRSSGGDPYYYRKMSFLDRTRDERIGMATTEQSENLRDSIAYLSRRLEKVWRYRAWSTAKRRHVLFDLWDECAERGSTQVVEAAERARATIIAFIRRRLPAGSGSEYSRGELARLNVRRQSKLAFVPYLRTPEPIGSN